MKYFDAFRWDDGQQTLWRGPNPVRLTNKAGALLRVLLNHAGRPVSKDAILASVWPDTHVLPDNIKVLVHEIRLALGDLAHPTRYIHCEPRRGYSFMVPVSEDCARDVQAAPPFINRGPELALLADAFDAAVAGRRRFVLLRGERGAGKSALAAACVRTARSNGPLRSATGQCVPSARPSEPFAPILDALHRLCRLYPSTVPETLARHAPEWLAQFPEWAPGLAPVLRSTDRQTLLTQLTAAVDHLADECPLVLVLEDLEWADEDTRIALGALASVREPAKLLVIGTGNAFVTMLRRWPIAFGGSPNVSTIDVTPLLRAHVERYLDVRFGPGCVSDLASAVHAASGGNPGLMVASVEALVAHGWLARRDGRWQLARSLAAISRALPGTLEGLLARHLDALDSDDLRVLTAAAASGPNFSVSAVANAVGRPRRTLVEQCWALVRQGLIAPQEQQPTLVRVEHFRFCFPQQIELLGRRTSAARRQPMAATHHGLARQAQIA